MTITDGNGCLVNIAYKHDRLQYA